MLDVQRRVRSVLVETPTALILGAGSSAHCGYPLGTQLVSQLVRGRGSHELDELPLAVTADEARQFLTRLSRSGHYSIDAFLEANRDHAALGKYLIARELKRHEDLDRLFPPNGSGWYQYLFNRLLPDAGQPDFSRNKLSIITFNYDRSLEAYLHAALQARFNLAEDRASEVLAGLRIIHVHGILGDYPRVSYEVAATPEQLVRISEQIQIIHETADRDDGFCNQAFEESNRVLHDTQRIYFMGFGFHPDNVRRFRFFTQGSLEGRTVYGTTHGMGARDRQTLHNRLAASGFAPSMLPPDGVECNRVFSQAAVLD